MKSSCVQKWQPRWRQMAASIGLIAFAQTVSADFHWEASGFGTLAWTVTDLADAEYTLGSVPKGADSSGTFIVDSRLGVQFDAGLGEQFSVTVQGLAQQNGEGDFAPDINWAFVRTQLNPNLALRVGRMGERAFLDSEYREVGYANTMIRPPEDFYRQSPLRAYDGAELTGEFDMGDWLTTVELYGGQSDLSLAFDIDYRTRDILGATIEFSSDYTRWRFGYQRGRVDVSNPDSLNFGMILNEVLPMVPSLADEALDFNGKSKAFEYLSGGVRIDLEPLILTGEVSQRVVTDSIIPDTISGYLAASYRTGPFTPYAFLSSIDQTSRTQANAVDGPGVEELVDLATLVYKSVDQKTAGIGLRWDFRSNFALKAQLEHIDRDEVGQNFVAGYDGANSGGESVRLFAIGLDVVF